MDPYDNTKYEEEYVFGDPPERDGHGFSKNSFRVQTPQVKIRWKDKLLVGEVYAEPTGIMLNIICPKCLHSIKISSTRKAMEWDEKRGQISVEPFQCPWELDTEVAVGQYTNLCKWSVAIDKNIAKDA